MPRAADRSPLRGDTVLFLVCVTISMAALLTPGAWTQSIANSIRRTALAPVVWVQQRAEEGRTSRARFRAAMAERDSAVMAAAAAQRLAGENAELRRLLGLRARGGAAGFVPAEVLHQPLPTDGHTLLLSVGGRDGVSPFMPVLAGDGLLGVVARVGGSSSIAHTWAHGEFRASAVTEDGAVLGIVAPSFSPDPSLAVLEFRGVAYRDTIPDGTLLLTSGLGGVFPRGVPIGRVRGVRREELGWERVYLVIPTVNPGQVSHVLVLTSPPAGFAPPDAVAPDSARGGPAAASPDTVR